jgi:DNA-binding NarL/FixJ family response regulator
MLQLTPRQWRVVEMRLRGRGRRQIAAALGLSTRTVHEEFDRARAANGLVDEVDLLLAVDRERRSDPAA